MIRELSGLRAVPMLVEIDKAEQFAGVLKALPVEVGAVVVTATEPALAREAQYLLADVSARPVITESDAEAISVLAAVLAYMVRWRRSPRGSRIVIAGASRLPLLCPLLLTAGVFNVVFWDPQDSYSVPLSRVARDADVVVNLLGADDQVGRVAMDRPCGSVISPPADGRLLPLPGLVRAIAAAVGPLVDIAVYHACAVGMRRAASPHRLTPDLFTPGLVVEVAAQAQLVLDPWAARGPAQPTGARFPHSSRFHVGPAGDAAAGRSAPDGSAPGGSAVGRALRWRRTRLHRQGRQDGQGR